MTERKRPATPPKAPDPPEPSMPRTVTPQQPAVHPIGTPRGLSASAGALAVGAWLVERGLYPPEGKPWTVKIALDAIDRPASFAFSATRFHLTIQPDTWGYVFGHGDRTSTIVVTNFASARDRDEHRLVAMTPALKRIGSLVRDLEARYHIFFHRHHVAIQTDLPGAEPIIRAWVLSF